MSLLDYDGLDYHTGKFKTWVKKLLEGKSNTGHKHTKSDITDFPNSLPANGGNASTVNGHTVNSDVPANAKFTDTIYDDTEVKGSITELNSNLDTLEFGEQCGGKNLFDVSKIDLINVEYRNGVYTNKTIDSKTFFNAYIDYWNDDGYIRETPNELFSAYIKGKYSITGKIIEGCTKIRFKHNGTTDDITFFITPISYFGLEVGDTFTISMDVDGYNPSTVGGLIVKNIQIEKGSSATPYEPYIPSVKMLADEVNAQNSDLNGKANSSHTHTIANITNLQTTLDGKAASNHTHTQYLSTADISVTNISYTLPANTAAGWRKIARISLKYYYPCFDLYTTGNWYSQDKSTAHFQITERNGRVTINQISGFLGNDIARIRMVKEDNNIYVLEEYSQKIASTANEFYKFIIIGCIDSIEPLNGVIETNDDSVYKDIVTSDVVDIPSGYSINSGNISSQTVSKASSATYADNASTVNGHTVNSDVPANAKFTDTDTWRPLGTTADTACAGNDNRLSNARPASDVPAWAKASTKPKYNASEVGAAAANHTHNYLPLSGGTMTGDVTFSSSNKRMIKIHDTRGYADRSIDILNGASVACIEPTTDLEVALSTSTSKRWKYVYAQYMYVSSGTAVTSDRNLKNTINDLDAEISKEFIMGLKPSSFKYNESESDRTHFGLIAQDVEDVLKEMGLTTKDFAGLVIEQPKEKGENKTYALRYEEFIAPLIKTVQMQQKTIENLEERLSKLENKLSGNN